MADLIPTTVPAWKTSNGEEFVDKQKAAYHELTLSIEKLLEKRFFSSEIAADALCDLINKDGAGLALIIEEYVRNGAAFGDK